MTTPVVRNMRILVRRDDADQWELNDPILLKAEMGYEMDAQGLKFGDGLSTWSELPYFQGGFDGIDGGTPSLNLPGLSEATTMWPWGNYDVVIG